MRKYDKTKEYYHSAASIFSDFLPYSIENAKLLENYVRSPLPAHPHYPAISVSRDVSRIIHRYIYLGEKLLQKAAELTSLCTCFSRFVWGISACCMRI